MKKLIIFAALACVLCVPAFANDEVYFASLPFSLTNASQTNTVTVSNITGVSYAYLQNTGGGIVSLNVLSEDPSAITSFYMSENDTYINSSAYVAFGEYYRYVYDVNQFFTGYSTSIPITAFPTSATSSDVISEFSLFLENQPVPTPSVPSTFTIPRGNVAYFQVASNSDVNFVSHFAENSGLFSSGNVYGPWGDTYQRISVEASLPSSGIEFPRSGSDAIVWGKGEPLNVLGQTKVGVFTKSCSSGTYYAFYNPAYQSISASDGFGSTSVGSNVTVSGNFSFIRIYSLQQLLGISTSTDNYDTYYVGTPDGDGGVTWVDQDNQVDYPPSGGENQEDEPISSVSLIESIKRILRNILSEIESIFTFGFSAIRDLVDLMDEFVATFDDLYEWLPEECYTLLIACVSVAIAIGVFKVFL